MTTMSRHRSLWTGLGLFAAVSVLALTLTTFGEAPAANAAANRCLGREATIIDSGPVVEGTNGDDVIIAFTGQNDSLTVLGRDGNDVICAVSGSGVQSILISGGAGNDMMIGGGTLQGGAGNDVLYGTSSDEELYGQGGNDTIFARFGDDLLVGGNGDDDLFGEAGNDVLQADDGDDLLIDDEGENQLLCGAGFDGATDYLQQSDCEFNAAT